MIFCVEVLAIYENPGVTPSAARVTQRDNDFALAQQRASAVGRAVVPQDDEYMRTFAAPSRYGFGWQCRQWISVQADAVSVGNAIWTRLSTRALQAGTKVEVFSRDETAPGYVTGAATFRRSLPAGSGGDIG